MGFNCLHCFLCSIKRNIARRIVKPLNFEVRISDKIVSYLLVGHVIHTVKMPGILSYLNIFLGKVHIGLSVKVT